MDRTQESTQKIEKVRQVLAGAGVPGVILRSHANFAWITAGGTNHIQTSEEPGVAEILITADRAAVVTSNIEAGRIIEEQVPPRCFELLEYQWHRPESKEQLLTKALGPGPLDDDHEVPGSTAGRLVAELRRVLTEPEAERYRALAQDAAFALESACRSIKRHDSEQDMAALVADLCRARDLLPVVNLVAADHRIVVSTDVVYDGEAGSQIL